MEHRVCAHLPESLLTWGSVKVVDDCTPRAGERCSLEVEVELAAGIPQGLCIEVWTHFVSDIQRVQVEDSAAPAYFACRSPGLVFEPFAHPDAKVHGPGSCVPDRR